MPIDIGREMALPMEQIIGGPLQAIVRAQSLAASETANFIQTIGLETTTTSGTSTTQARLVSFSFKRLRPQLDPNTPAVDETVEMNVPLLTIVPVPFIRVEEATIDFECTVASSTLDTTQNNFNINASASGGFWGVKFSVNASYSYQSTHKDQVDKTATLKVNVKVVQDDMPGGLRKMLDILQSAVTDGRPAARTLPA